MKWLLSLLRWFLTLFKTGTSAPASIRQPRQPFPQHSQPRAGSAVVGQKAFSHASSQPVRWNPPPRRVQDVPSVAGRLQKRAASAFFAALGSKYVPWPIAERLHSHDVYYAIWDFTEYFNIPLEDLLRPSSPQHAKAKSSLLSTVDILVAVEAASKGTPLSVIPVVEALQLSIESAERALDRLERARAAWQLIADVSVFALAQERFNEVAMARLGAWNDVPEAELSDLVVTSDIYRQLKSRFDAASDAIDNQLEVLRRKREPLNDIIAAALNEREQLRKMLWAEECDDVGEVVFAMEHLAGSLGAIIREAVNPEWVAWREALDTLGLPQDTTWEGIKVQYRILIKMHHPDANFGAATAHDRTVQITTAYRELKTIYTRLGGVPPKPEDM